VFSPRKFACEKIKSCLLWEANCYEVLRKWVRLYSFFIRHSYIANWEGNLRLSPYNRSFDPSFLQGDLAISPQMKEELVIDQSNFLG
jgi:hypothetical protein